MHAEKKVGLILQYLARFRNPLVIILLLPAFLALTGDIASFFIIAAIVLMSVTLDFVQEHRAGEAAERLRRFRGGAGSGCCGMVSRLVAAGRPRAGRCGVLAAGDLIPGDGRILEAKDLFLNQALLTGEPFPVEKAPAELPDEKELAPGRQRRVHGHLRDQRHGQGAGLPNRRRHRIRRDRRQLSPQSRRPRPSSRGRTSFGMLIMRLTILLVLFVLLVNALSTGPGWNRSCSRWRSPSG